MASASARHLHRSGSSSSTSKWWRGKDSNLRRRKPADLQSAPVGRLGTPPQNEPRIVISTLEGVNALLARYLLGAGAPGPPAARSSASSSAVAAARAEPGRRSR